MVSASLINLSASVFLCLLKNLLWARVSVCFNMELLEYGSCWLFSPNSGYPFPLQQQRRVQVHSQKTITRNMGSTPSQFRLSSVQCHEEGQVRLQILGLFMLFVSRQGRKKGWLLYLGSYQTQRPWASSFYLSLCDFSWCLPCRLHPSSFLSYGYKNIKTV